MEYMDSTLLYKRNAKDAVERLSALWSRKAQDKVFAEAARGKFGVAPFIVIDAMNFVGEMRGTG